MTATQLDQAELDNVSRELAPDVLYIRANLANDWSGERAVYFRVVLSDSVDIDRLAEVSDRVTARL